MVQRIAVVGCSGRLGARVVRVLAEQGAAAVALSRRNGFDLSRSDPDQLARALDGCDAAIDCSGAGDRKPATFEAFSAALAVAAGRAGVGQLVAVSIVGIDRPGLALGIPGFADGSLLPGPDAEIDPTTVEEWVQAERLSPPVG